MSAHSEVIALVDRHLGQKAPPDIDPDFLEHLHRERIEPPELRWVPYSKGRPCQRSMLEGIGNSATMPGKPRRMRFILDE
jgi:hypothetical protein